MSYSFTVVAINAVGEGDPVAPSVPTGVSAEATPGVVKVTWSAPEKNGGSTITGYTVTSSPDRQTCTTSGALTCSFSDLTPGREYRFTVTATNTAGTSDPSDPSNPVTAWLPDTTGPVITIGGIEKGKSYVLGAVPTPTCTATDADSGVDGQCVGVVTGGNANKVGEFTYKATATDNAGNATTVTVTFKVVYRFDGFAQPINDAALTPGVARSVFKAGSTVPVKIQLRSADGTIVASATAPVWMTPQRGAATNSTPNEQVWVDPATSGNEFKLASDEWHYNWSTKGFDAGYTYRIGAILDDGTTRTVVIALR